MAELHQISFPIEKELSQCVELYDKVLSHEDDLLGTILEHVRSRKGKMMRPILVLLTAKEFAPVNEVTYNVALALELFHNASLLHDDVVDELFDRVKAELIELIKNDPKRGEQEVDMLMIAKYLERIGDHATNIAEWVIYSLDNKVKENQNV